MDLEYQFNDMPSLVESKPPLIKGFGTYLFKFDSKSIVTYREIFGNQRMLSCINTYSDSQNIIPYLSKTSLLNTETFQFEFTLISKPLLFEDFNFGKFPSAETNSSEDEETDLINSADGERNYVNSENPLCSPFVDNLNMIFVKYSLCYEAVNTHAERIPGQNIPDITVYSNNRKTIIFYVEVKNDMNEFLKSAEQAVGYAKDLLVYNKNREFSSCVLSSPDEFTVFCAYLHKGEIVSSQLVKKTYFEWDFSNAGFRKLLGLFLTDFNWYGSLFIPSSDKKSFSNNTFLTNHSVLNLNSSSHHFVSMFLFLLVLLYLYGMKTKVKQIPKIFDQS
jgi:hypothetical protein